MINYCSITPVHYVCPREGAWPLYFSLSERGVADLYFALSEGLAFVLVSLTEGGVASASCSQ